jgi:glutathione synthase
MIKALGVVMDPIESINVKKDSTLAMLLEAKKRGWALYYFEQKDLYLRDGIAYGKSRLLNVFSDKNHWFEL